MNMPFIEIGEKVYKQKGKYKLLPITKDELEYIFKLLSGQSENKMNRRIMKKIKDCYWRGRILNFDKLK